MSIGGNAAAMPPRSPRDDGPWITVPEALATLANGGMVIIVDSADDGATGDVLFAASHADAARVNFLIRETRGVLYLGLTDERCRALDLTQMVTRNKPGTWQSAFTVSIEARHGVTTGISAADRARTIQVAIAAESTAADIRRPGHIFPLRAHPAGTLGRCGRTESYVDLPRLAGLYAAGVAASVINDDGTLARLPELIEFGRRHGIGMLTVDNVAQYRLRTEDLARRVGVSTFCDDAGLVTSRRYRDLAKGSDFLTVEYPGADSAADGTRLVALAKRCVEGHVLGSSSCDCRRDLDADVRALRRKGGLLLWLTGEQVCPTGSVLSGEPYEMAVLASLVQAAGATAVELLPSAAPLEPALSARGLPARRRTPSSQLPRTPAEALTRGAAQS